MLTISPPETLAERLRPLLLHLNRDLRREALPLGATVGQVALLAAIREQPGLSMRELANRERMSAPAMTKPGMPAPKSSEAPLRGTPAQPSAGAATPRTPKPAPVVTGAADAFGKPKIWSFQPVAASPPPAHKQHEHRTQSRRACRGRLPVGDQ